MEKMKSICKNCFLSSTALMNYNIFCGLNGQAVKYPDGYCRFCITDDDVKAARKEYLERKHRIKYSNLKRQAEMAEVVASILLIKLEREKLRLEKEQHFGCENGRMTSSDDFYRYPSDQVKKTVSGMVTFFCENCGEYVLVPAEGVGKKVHWKCMCCHQENCFEVAQE